MQYYKIEALVVDKELSKHDKDRRYLADMERNINQSSKDFKEMNKNEYYLFTYCVNEIIRVGAFVINSDKDIQQIAYNYFKKIEIEVKNIICEEITTEKIIYFLSESFRKNYIDDDDEILEELGIDLLNKFNRSFNFAESIISVIGKDEAYDNASKYLSLETLKPELDRIYTANPYENIQGHPVHYMVETDNRDIRKGMCITIVSALYENKRLMNRRYAFIDVRERDRISYRVVNAIYSSNKGGTVIWRLEGYNETEEESERANPIFDILECVCHIMKKYRNSVLTIFCMPRECTKLKNFYFENLENNTFVEIREDCVSGKRAQEFLERVAYDAGIETDEELYSKLKEDENYISEGLQNIFDEWYGHKLKNTIYPQYKELISVKKLVAEKKPRGSAYDELMNMVGLCEVKNVINNALDYFKAQKLFADKGMVVDQPAMHMVFTGNPGTAKTSVARLFAKIMRDNGILSKGHLVEVGRADLVGKYVGWTAPTIKKKFKEAKGGVLFIDEAYSLVDDRGGSFGDEAINTIVQEMENHRDELIVIFAGYSGEMETFLKRNPGLRSRIAYHVPFNDYTVEELCDIAEIMASKKNITISEDARSKLKDVFETAVLDDDFGNGRYVRNIIEKSRMAQANRLLKKDYNDISNEDIETIVAEDIEMPINMKQVKKQIGFVS